MSEDRQDGRRVEDTLSYSFKEFWEDRFRRLTSDIEEIKGDVRGLQTGQDKQGKDLAVMQGKMLVYGSIAITLGIVIANALSKVWNQ